MKLKLKNIISKENLILAILSGLFTTIFNLLKHRGLQATLKSVGGKVLLKGDKNKTSEEALSDAKEIIELLRANHITYERIERIGIDGIPGSGKSTLARTLAKLTGFEWRNFHHPEIESRCDLYNIATIYEHHRLFRTQDIDNFGLIIYIDEPVDVSKKRVLGRKTSGILIDVLDYDKLKKIGDLAFKFADGEYFEIKDSCIKIKCRPEKGYNQVQNIKSELEKRGIHLDGPCTKEEMLFLLAYGKKEKGLNAYIEYGTYNKDILAGFKAFLTGLFKI